MKKKKPAATTPRPRISTHPLGRLHVPPTDLHLFARSFHEAAKTLAASFRSGSGDVAAAMSPVIFTYRHALELHLKAIVLCEGGNFLATRPDALSIYNTHSVSWLAQFICQIVTALKWETQFRCEGIETLTEFKAVIEELNAADPGSYVFQPPIGAEVRNDPPDRVNQTIGDFARRMDALLDLLDSTADALAAEWDTRSKPPIAPEPGGAAFGPWIQ